MRQGLCLFVCLFACFSYHQGCFTQPLIDQQLACCLFMFLINMWNNEKEERKKEKIKITIDKIRQNQLILGKHTTQTRGEQNLWNNYSLFYHQSKENSEQLKYSFLCFDPQFLKERKIWFFSASSLTAGDHHLLMTNVSRTATVSVQCVCSCVHQVIHTIDCQQLEMYAFLEGLCAATYSKLNKQISTTNGDFSFSYDGKKESAKKKSGI